MTNLLPLSNLRGEFRDAKRVQQSVLAGVEKKLLIGMARKLPSAINADHLTLLGFVSMIAAGCAYALTPYWPAALWIVNVMLAFNWFGDSMDGTVARVRNQLRPRYGCYVDHIIDALSAVFLFGGLGLSGVMSGVTAMGLLVCYLLLAIQSYLAAHSLGEFHISWWKFSPTEMRILLAAGNIAAFYRPTTVIFGPRLLFFDVAGTIGIVCMLIVLAATTIRNTTKLYREERI
ncbi:MAG: CDP-alcohol phosphatidyltransferase family protein [Candidatus Solibacter usitatus]|nr:CDP-alcohol phosphatidyltransferase family protein [Candidatus Solibacter usitatus]